MNEYTWFCGACDRPFAGGGTSPAKCSLCGRKTNGGFGLPFAPLPDFDRVDIETRTFTPYEGDNEWVEAANRMLRAQSLIGKEIKEAVDAGLRLTKRQATLLAKKFGNDS